MDYQLKEYIKLTHNGFINIKPRRKQ